MQQYELTIIFLPDLTEKKADAIIDKLAVKVVSRQVWGKRLLAYPIDNHKEGLYIHLVIELADTTVSDLERQLQLTDEIIRHLLVKAEDTI